MSHPAGQMALASPSSLLLCGGAQTSQFCTPTWRRAALEVKEAADDPVSARVGGLRLWPAGPACTSKHVQAECHEDRGNADDDSRGHRHACCVEQESGADAGQDAGDCGRWMRRTRRPPGRAWRSSGGSPRYAAGKTMSSTLVATIRTKVKIPRTIRAGRTVATTGARWWIAAAKKPKAIKALDTQVR